MCTQPCLRPAIAHLSTYTSTYSSIAVPWLVCVTIADASPSALVFVQAEFESKDNDNRAQTVHDGSPKNDENTYSSSEILHVAECAEDGSGSHLTFSVYSFYCFAFVRDNLGVHLVKWLQS